MTRDEELDHLARQITDWPVNFRYVRANQLNSTPVFMTNSNPTTFTKYEVARRRKELGLDKGESLRDYWDDSTPIPEVGQWFRISPSYTRHQYLKQFVGKDLQLVSHTPQHDSPAVLTFKDENECLGVMYFAAGQLIPCLSKEQRVIESLALHYRSMYTGYLTHASPETVACDTYQFFKDKDLLK